jgi:hypothetical protein
MRTKILFCLCVAMTMVDLFFILPTFGDQAPSETGENSTPVAAAESSAGVSPVLHEAGGQEHKTSGTAYSPRLIWEADDCGCTPIQPERKPGQTKITYGFYHQDMETKENKEKTIAVAKIKFSRLNRIGYASLVYDEQKGFLNYEDWENNGFVKNARRYNSRVDLVVRFQKNPKVLFSNKSKTRTLAREIEQLIKDHGGSGVTMDFRNTSDLDTEIVHGFVSVLREKLMKIDKQLYLNLFFEFDETVKDREFNTFSLAQVGNMMDVIDLFLIMIPPNNSHEKNASGICHENVSGIVDRFLILSDRLDLYGIKHNDNGLKDKTLPVFTKDTEKNEVFFNQILSVGYGGIGYWPEKSLADKETQFIGFVFKNRPLPEQMDLVKKVLYTLCPDCCKQICPNRKILIVITQILGTALILYYILALFFCELRSFAAIHALYFIGTCLVFTGLVAGLILCVPSWQGKRTLAIALLILCGAGYIVKEVIRKRREAGFP